MGFCICSHEYLLHMEMFSWDIQYQYSFLSVKLRNCQDVMYSQPSLESVLNGDSPLLTLQCFGTVKISTQENRSFLLAWLVWQCQESKLFWFIGATGRLQEKMTMQKQQQQQQQNKTKQQHILYFCWCSVCRKQTAQSTLSHTWKTQGRKVEDNTYVFAM